MLTTPPPYFTDAEIADMCEGLRQPAAMIKHLRRLGLRVDKKPNGRPLAWRPASAPLQAGLPEPEGMNIVALQQWAAGRKGRKSGTKTQGR